MNLSTHRHLIGIVAVAVLACSSSPPKSTPTITSVSRAAMCGAGGTLTLQGTAFHTGATIAIQATPAVTATGVTVSADGTTATATFATIPVGGPYDLKLENADGGSATKAAAVTVVANPQVFYVDPSVVYDGLSVQATVYGAGFEEPVTSVSIQPAGGGTAIPMTFSEDSTRPNQVQIVVPAGTAAGVYDVHLDDAMCSGALPGALTVTSQTTLAIASITPAQGWTGAETAITIAAQTGTSFQPVPRVYLNPSSQTSSTVAGAVGAVALVDTANLSAVVPAGLPAGPYDVIVVNPDGGVGVQPGGFEVVPDPPPTITALLPGSLPNTLAQTFTIAGANFRGPAVSLTCIDATGAATPAPPVTVSASTASTITVATNASGTTAAACALRVTDDDGTFGDFSALVFTSPAQNLTAPHAGPALQQARRAPVALGGDATSAARFLHVIGGDDGTGGGMATVESAPLSLLGVPGAFFVQRTTLTQPRTAAAGALIGRYLYVAGGSAAGVALDTVERAAVLDPAQRAVLTGIVLENAASGAGVGAGLWYYRVAAVLDGSDPVNPGGENLASDPRPVLLPNLNGRTFDVVLTWDAVTNASKYRVYRSPTAGAAVGTEQVIAEVTAPTTRYVDTGVTTMLSMDNPLPIGSLGAWTVLGARLGAAREGAGVAWARDPSDATKTYLYVVGGRTGTTALSSVEFLPITVNADGTQTPGQAFVAATSSLSAARWQVAALQASAANTPAVTGTDTYLYALSGLSGTGSVVATVEVAKVQAGGQLASFSTLPQVHRAGYAAALAGDFLFAFGGNNGAPDDTIVSAQIATAPSLVNWNNEGITMTAPRLLPGGTASGAYIYVAGGVTSAATTPPTVTNTTEYFLW